MRPDIIIMRKIHEVLNDSIKITSEERNGFLSIKVLQLNNEKKLYSNIIHHLNSNLKGCRPNNSNSFNNYPAFILRNIKEKIIKNNSNYIVIDWKYHDESFFKCDSEKLRNDITKQLCYEFTMSQAYSNHTIEAQFFIPSFEKSSENIVRRIENSFLFSKLRSSGITVFKANFTLIQQAYLNNDEPQ